MPNAPLRVCAEPGCPQLVRHGRCTAHQKAVQRVKDQRRGTRHQRGYTNRWDAYSKARLAKYPWCVGYPEGIHGSLRKLAEVTDHILPAATHPELFWEPTNHQSMCRACNSRKGQTQSPADRGGDRPETASMHFNGSSSATNISI